MPRTKCIWYEMPLTSVFSECRCVFVFGVSVLSFYHDIHVATIYNYVCTLTTSQQDPKLQTPFESVINVLSINTCKYIHLRSDVVCPQTFLHPCNIDFVVVIFSITGTVQKNALTMTCNSCVTHSCHFIIVILQIFHIRYNTMVYQYINILKAKSFDAKNTKFVMNLP